MPRRIVRSVLAVVLGLLLVVPAAGWSQSGTLFIHHIDVGQGDATLIMSPGRRTVLIDGGNNGMGASRVLPLLAPLNINRLDVVVATHYDADHIGGLDEVITGLRGEVTTVYDRGDPRKNTTTKTYNCYVRAVGVKRRTIEVGAAINLGREITLVCVAVNGHVSRAGSVSLGTGAENDASVALKLRYGGFDYFIGGDLTGGGRSGSKRTADVEGLVAAVVGDVDVLKVSHHGSTTSSNPTFLATLKPEVAIISVGTGGSNKSRYHHPSREVLDRLLILPGLQAIFMTTRGKTVGGLKPRDLRVIRIAGEDVTLSTDGLMYMVNGQVFPVDERPARPR